MRERLGLGLTGVVAGESAAPKEASKVIKKEEDEDLEL